MIKVVVLNDTSNESHHGCDRVMDNLYTNIRAWNGEVTHVSYLNDDLSLPLLAENLDRCDLAVINGEGTIHHGSVYAESLLKLVARSTAGRKYLINTTYQANPKSYKQYLRQFDGIYVRDTLSKLELLAIEIDSEVVPDLTFFSGPERVLNSKRSGTLVGCSVDRQAAIILYEARSKFTDVMPLSILKKTRSFLMRLKEVRYSMAVRDLKNPQFLIKSALARFWFSRNASNTHKEHARNIALSDFVLSGRYHTLCMAMKNEIPFLVTPSNTFKVEALLADAGLKNRMITKEELGRKNEVEIDPFSDEELENLRVFNLLATSKIDKMFQNIFSSENNG